MEIYVLKMSFRKDKPLSAYRGYMKAKVICIADRYIDSY